MIRPLLSLIFSILIVQATAQTAPSDPLQDLKDALTELRKSKDLRNGMLGFQVMEVESGEVLASNNASKTLLPASTLKTFTSGASLSILRESFTFQTELQYDGTIDANGVLQGNLYIKGGGDPTLGSDRFPGRTDISTVQHKWLDAIAEAGIKEINGSVIGDASIFEDALIPETWVWQDIGNYYGAGACGLTFHENTYYLYFKPHATVGEKAEVLRAEPPMPNIEFINEMKTGKRGSGDNGYIFGTHYSYHRYLRGSIPQGKEEFSIKGCIPDPALYAADTLSRFLREAGIEVSGGASTMRLLNIEDKAPEGERTRIHKHTSPKLKEIIYWLNKKSINLYAETILKMCGHRRYGLGSTDNGLKAVRLYWAAKGLDLDGLQQQDGSGLSRYNGITPGQLAGALRIVAQQPWYKGFHESLPIAGDSKDIGSIRSLCKGTSAANNLRAKSGYISRVRGYAGYVTNQSGKLLSFAMLANNYSCSNRTMKKHFEKLMILLAELK